MSTVSTVSTVSTSTSISNTAPDPRSRPTTVTISRAEAAVLLDRLPETVTLDTISAVEHEILDGLHQHLVKFFKGEVQH